MAEIYNAEKTQALKAAEALTDAYREVAQGGSQDHRRRAGR
jgi:hypothetical protein